VTPQPDWFSVADNIRFLSQVANFSGYYGEGTGETPPGSDLAELKSYLMAKMLWDPTQDKFQIIHEFLEGYYGDAAPDIYQYMQVWNASIARHGARPLPSVFSRPPPTVSLAFAQVATMVVVATTLCRRLAGSRPRP